MIKIEKSIKSLYTINLLEGEGVGTAYEYYAKLRKLRRFMNSIGTPRNVLIAGLPEKYGLSMDFFLLAQALGAETVIVDDRALALERAKRVICTLESKKLIADIKPSFVKVDHIAEVCDNSFYKSKFDLALSSEVLQRLNEDRAAYIARLRELATHFAIFAPNRGNESHAKLSGLRSVHLEELLKYCREGNSKVTIYDSGFLDMPPFPPGLSRSQEKREQARSSRIEAILMKSLEIYSLCESILPEFIKAKIAHIVYVMVVIPQSS